MIKFRDLSKFKLTKIYLGIFFDALIRGEVKYALFTLYMIYQLYFVSLERQKRDRQRAQRRVNTNAYS